MLWCCIMCVLILAFPFRISDHVSMTILHSWVGKVALIGHKRSIEGTCEFFILFCEDKESHIQVSSVWFDYIPQVAPCFPAPRELKLFQHFAVEPAKLCRNFSLFKAYLSVKLFLLKGKMHLVSICRVISLRYGGEKKPGNWDSMAQALWELRVTVLNSCCSHTGLSWWATLFHVFCLGAF